MAHCGARVCAQWSSWRTRALFSLEHRIVLPDGAERIVHEKAEIVYDSAGQPARWLGTVQDITERKWVEMALVQSEKKYRLLVDTLQEGIWMVDSDLQTTFVNPRMAEMLGCSVEAMLGKPVSCFADRRGMERYARAFERRRQGFTEPHDLEFVRRDGSRLHAIVSAAPVMDADGRYIGALTGVVDVTLRRQMERRLLESEESFRNLAESAPDGIAIVSREGRHLYASRRMAELTRYELDEFMQLQMSHLFQPAVYETLGQRLKDRFAGQAVPSRYETVFLRKDGSLLPAEVSINQTVWQNEVSLLAFVRDITERRRMEGEIL